LSATLHPSDPDLQPLSKTLTVHTRRYTSHSHTLELAPETHSLDDPTRVEVQVPRATFKAGEPIPVYVKVPPPRRELVVDQGLRLRNIRAELIRVVKVKRDEGDNHSIDTDIDTISEMEQAIEVDRSMEEGPSTAAVSTAVEKPSRIPWSTEEPDSPLFHGSSYKTVVSRSGAACRFHSSLPVRLRFVLRQPPPSSSPSDQPRNLPDGEYGYLDGDTHCASITQTSLLHSVSFRVNIHASFVDMSNRTERFSTVSVPVMIIPPPATLPEVEEWIDAAYQKKHDRPPARTVRLDDMDVSAPRYHDGEAGPSLLQGGAPPPFEERDAPPPFFSHSAEASTSSRYAPPPFFSHEPEASTSNRLPTFLESEAEIFVPTEADTMALLPPAQPIIPGEGTQFGFPPSEQFDGHSEEMQRSSTPPPTLEMATRDTNVTNLADLSEPQRTMEALGIALGEQEEATRERELPPPPPPAMDDPSDPPPSIDSDFRSPDLHLRHSPPPHSASPPPLPTSTYNHPTEQTNSLRSSSPAQVTIQTRTSHGHAPPPYLVPGNGGDQEHVTRPPPYMDLMHLTSDRH
jgi:neural Wiskott-Aldrich syndrome protein